MDEPRSELDDVDRLRATGASFELVFGSRARGDHQDDADLDVAAWWPESPPREPTRAVGGVACPA